MKTFILFTLIIIPIVTSCATTSTPSSTLTTKVSEIHAKADRLGTISGKIIKRVGPLVTAGVCLASPVYCAPAKAAYKGAVVAINAIEAAKTAEDGLKLAALAEEIQKNMVTINEVLVALGQEKIDLTELQSTVKECQALTTQ